MPLRKPSKSIPNSSHRKSAHKKASDAECQSSLAPTQGHRINAFWLTLRRLTSAAAVQIACLLLAAASAMAVDDGLAKTPPMGWNSWNGFELNINEQLIRDTADAIATNGMREAGYRYVIVDAGWKARNRDADSRLTFDTNRFPSGMKALGNYIHSKGLKFGIYTDAGSQDCVAGTPGSKGFEELDASTFAEWGVDFLKEDWCNSEGLVAREAYTKMHEAIVAAGRPVVFSICEWGDNQPWEWAANVGHLWRTTGDNKACWDCGRDTMTKSGGYPRGWTLILDAQIPLQKFTGPGHWNDPDMLEVGVPGLSLDECRAHFSLWSILAAPLIAGCDLRSVPPSIADILTNREVIAVDQDALGIQGSRVEKHGDLEVWMKPLTGTDVAVVLFNRSAATAEITAPFADLKLEKLPHAIRDLWARKDLGQFENAYGASVPSHGCVMIRISGGKRATR